MLAGEKDDEYIGLLSFDWIDVIVTRLCISTDFKGQEQLSFDFSRIELSVNRLRSKRRCCITRGITSVLLGPTTISVPHASPEFSTNLQLRKQHLLRVNAGHRGEPLIH